MQALQIDEYAPLSELRARKITAPKLGPNDVRIAIYAAAINPSDIGSAEGRFANSPLPRILGRDFAGRVAEGPAELKGADVWGSGGDLGISRDGTHADQIVLPVSAVSLRPSNISVEEAAASGVPFVTAWSALVDAGQLQPNEWVIVSGAAGGVGTAATQIAAARGAHVIALVLNGDEAGRIDRTKAAAVARSDQNDLASVVRNATGGRGADVALNGVGAVLFQPMLDALRDGGRMAIYSAAAGREAPLDLFGLYRRRQQIIGVNTAVVDATASARILTELRPLFEHGLIRPLHVAETYRLSDAARAYGRVSQGVVGKIVLVPDSHYPD